MIYLNQAATTWPKPAVVEKAVQAAIALPPFSQHRSMVADVSDDIGELCRKNLAKLFHIEDYQRIYFTSGATDAFNWVVRGLELEGQKVLATQNEHNAVLRPLYNIYKNLKIDIVNCDKEGRLDDSDLEKKLSKDIKAVFVNHCSNVTGISVDLMKISDLVHKNDAILVVDVSQSAGVLDIDVKTQGIDILVFTGHKGLYGPQGTGGFYVSSEVSLKPSNYGGTGYDSKRLVMEEASLEYEVGTQNYHGIYGLNAGVEFVLQEGLEKIQRKEQQFMNVLKEELGRLEHVEMYGTVYEDGIITGPVLSFNLKKLNPAEVSYFLATSYDIVVRSGFHCAPLIHQALGCEEKGTVRVSVSYFNTMEEIAQFINAIKELEQSL